VIQYRGLLSDSNGSYMNIFRLLGDYYWNFVSGLGVRYRLQKEDLKVIVRVRK